MLGALAVSGPATAAERQTVGLPYAPALLPPEPPFAPTFAGEREIRLPGRARTATDVSVGIDSEGRPHTVRAVQRISLSGLGDYTFSVPAPVIDVRPAAGTDSPPGQRAGQIVWQGFSPGRKLLAASALLNVRSATRLLPVRVLVTTHIGGEPLAPGQRASGPVDVTVTVRNTTAARVETFTANADRLSAAQALDVLRAAESRSLATPSRLVVVSGRALPRSVTVSAQLKIDGALRFRSGQVRFRTDGTTARFHGIVGGTRPEVLRFRFRGAAVRAGSPTVRIAVTPAARDPAVRPPGRTWVEAVRRRRTRESGRELLARAIDLDLSYARARQYQMFLWSPDPAHSRTSYVYRTAAAPTVRQPSVEASGGGTDTLALALVLAGVVIGAGLLVVVWAHL